MSGLEVQPLELVSGAQKADHAAEVLGAVARAVAALGRLGTGRPDSALLAELVLQQLGAAVQALGAAAARDGQALRTAGATYAAAELRAGGSQACG